ncbi:MAG: hypothetical protein AAF773_06685 [Cyanobacteria bacterium P01_D01_bin.115]
MGVAAALNFAVWYRSEAIALAVYAAQPITLEQALRVKPMVRQLCDRVNSFFITSTADCKRLTTANRFGTDEDGSDLHQRDRPESRTAADGHGLGWVRPRIWPLDCG